MLDVIRRVAPLVPDEDARAALRVEADAIREAAAARVLVEVDRQDVESAWLATTAAMRVAK
jgi:hypothetical protein